MIELDKNLRILDNVSRLSNSSKRHVACLIEVRYNSRKRATFKVDNTSNNRERYAQLGFVAVDFGRKIKVNSYKSIGDKISTVNFVGFNQSIIDYHNNQCDITIDGEIKNNPYTIHAESYAIAKFNNWLNKSKVNINDIVSIDIYSNWAPCVECTKNIILMKTVTLNDTIKRIKFTLRYINEKETFRGIHVDTNEKRLIPFNVLVNEDINIIKI